MTSEFGFFVVKMLWFETKILNTGQVKGILWQKKWHFQTIIGGHLENAAILDFWVANLTTCIHFWRISLVYSIICSTNRTLFTSGRWYVDREAKINEF